MYDLVLYLYLFIQTLNYPSSLGYSNVPITQKSISLENRNSNEFVNNVFKDNILLTLNYMGEAVNDKSEIDWAEVQKPKNFQFTLSPGEGFAFHDQIAEKYGDNIVKTTNADFNHQDGFKSDGYLMGDGVCHLASLIYWAAKDAGLTAIAPTNHDFAKINEVPKEYGVSIYRMPGAIENSSRQNLYIKNNFEESVSFVFNYDGEKLTVYVLKSSS